MIDDRQAVALRSVTSDLVRKKDDLDPFQMKVLQHSQSRLMDYERKVLGQQREPYREPVTASLENLNRFEKDLNGKDPITDAELDPETRSKVIGVAYLATKFGKPEQEVFDNYQAFEKALLQYHESDSLQTALLSDIEETRQQTILRHKINRDAFASAARGESLFDSVTRFTANQKEPVPEGTGNLYGRIFNQARVTFDEKRPQFDKLLTAMETAVEEVSLSPDNLEKAALALADIDPKDRQLAFTYLAANIQDEGSALKVGAQALRTTLSRFLKDDVRARTLQVERLREAMDKGEDLFVMRTRDGRKTMEPSPAFRQTMGTIMAILPESQAPTMAIIDPDNPRQPFRRLTETEKRALGGDLKTASEITRLLVDVEAFVNQSVSDAPEGLLEGFTEKVVYGGIQLAPEMAYFLGSMAVGRGLGSATSASRLYGTALALRGSQAAVEVEHFRGIMRESPDVDPETALAMSKISGSIGGAMEAFGMGLVLSRLPAVGKLISNWRTSTISSPALAALKTMGETMAIETATELAQDYTSQLTQAVFGAFDEDLRDPKLGEALKETIRTAPDVALALLPYALIGGGNAALMTRDIQQGFVGMVEDGTLDFVLGENAAKQVLEQPSLSKKIAELKKHVSLEKLDSQIQEALKEGTAVETFLAKHAATMAQGMPEMGSAEPTIHPVKGEDGKVNEYAFESPEGNVEFFPSKQDAVNRARLWYEERGIEDVVDTSDRAKVHSAKPQPYAAPEQPAGFDFDEASAIEAQAAKDAGRKFTGDPNLGQNFPNKAQAVFESSAVKKAQTVKVGAKTITLAPDAPVSAPQVMDAFTGLLKTAGHGGAIRTGRMHPARKAAGFFMPTDQIIRIRTANNVHVAAHELGHALDHALFRPQGLKFGKGHVWERNPDIPKPVVTELRKLGKALYAKEPHNKWGSEGFAEFTRLYLTDPEQAQAKAPETVKFVQEVFRSMPKLEAAVTEAQVNGTTFWRQGATNRGKAAIAPTPTPTERLKRRVEESDAMRDFFDAAIAVDRFWQEAQRRRIAGGMDPLNPALNPMLTLSSRRMTVDAVVDHMARRGMLDYSGHHVGRPLTDTFSLVQGKVDEFIVYLYAKRTIALAEDPRGPRSSGMSVKDARTIISQFDQEPNFALAAEHFYDWHNGVLDYVAAASPALAKGVEHIREVDPGFYLPLQREFESVARAVNSSGSGGVVGKNLVKKLKGSTRRIKDPVESSIANAKKMILKADQTRILEQIINIQKITPGMGHLVTKVDRDMIVSGKIRVDEMIAKTWGMVQAYLNANGVDPTAAEAGFEKAMTDMGGELHIMFAPAVVPSNQNEAPVMPIYRVDPRTGEGKVEWYELDPDLWTALMSMDRASFGPVGDLLLTKPAQAFRYGTTGLNAGFSMVSNPLRDFRTLHLNSMAQANTGKLFGEWMKNIVALFLHSINVGSYRSEWIDFYERMGARMAQPLNQDGLSLRRMGGRVKLGGKTIDPSQPWKTFKAIPGNAIDLLKEFLQFGESAARLTEGKLLMEERGLDPNGPISIHDSDLIRLAMKRVTTDFTRAGRIARKVNMAVPFFNAAIQGPAAHIEAAKRDPIKFAWRAMQGTLLTLVNWYANKDEDWWVEMDENERYLYTYIRIGDELVRIPRAFEADGLFMAGAEALADAWYRKDPAAAGRWFREWLSQLGPVDVTFSRGILGTVSDLTPVLPGAILEQAFNRDLFFDIPIVPRSQEDLFASEQFSPYTTTLSVELGKLLNVSPRRLDHAIRSVGGGVAVDIVELLGKGEAFGEDPIEKDWEPADVPVFGRLFQRGGQIPRSPKSIDALYDAYGHAKKVQLSDRIEETPEQRAERLRLNDAVTYLSGLRQLGNRSKRRDVRLQVEKEMVEVAKRALSGEYGRAQMRVLVREFERNIETQNKQNQ